MQEEEIARCEIADEATGHALGPTLDGVVAATGPRGEMEAATRQDGLEKQVADAGRSAEPGRPTTDQAGDRFLGSVDLARLGPRTVEAESVRMVVGVVLHAVPATGDLAGQLGMRGRAATEDEEAGARVVGVEKIENPRRDLGIGSVVEGERDLVPVVDRAGSFLRFDLVEPANVRAEEATARPDDGDAEGQVVERQRGEESPSLLRKKRAGDERADVQRQAGTQERRQAPGPRIRGRFGVVGQGRERDSGMGGEGRS